MSAAPQPLTLSADALGHGLIIGPASTPEAEARRARLQAALDAAADCKTAQRRPRGGR